METIGCSIATKGVEPAIAVELIGAARALRGKLDISLGPAREAAIEKMLDRFRDEIGEPTFAKSFERGQKMPLQKAISSALSIAA